MNREQLWQKYLDDNLKPATSGIRQHIESGFEALESPQPIYRSSNLGHSTPKNPQPLLLTPIEKRARKRSIRNHTTAIALAHGTIPEELFLKLAQTSRDLFLLQSPFRCGLPEKLVF